MSSNGMTSRLNGVNNKSNVTANAAFLNAFSPELSECWPEIVKWNLTWFGWRESVTEQSMKDGCKESNGKAQRDKPVFDQVRVDLCWLVKPPDEDNEDDYPMRGDVDAAMVKCHSAIEQQCRYDEEEDVLRNG